MGRNVLIGVKCPGCSRMMPAAPGANLAICACGYRIDTRGLTGEPYKAESITVVDFIKESRAHWAELHTKSDPTRQWFDDWQERIPSIGCDCRKHWKVLVEKMPPDFSSTKAFFVWSVAAHNVVNERLGKPIWKPPACAVCNKPSTRICSYTLSLGMCGYPLCDDCTHAHTL